MFSFQQKKWPGITVKETEKKLFVGVRLHKMVSIRDKNKTLTIWLHHTPIEKCQLTSIKPIEFVTVSAVT